tara:strand:+ start:271 stop:591 length:321 start_codon:yes stop_codon:yes gene_type:complete
MKFVFVDNDGQVMAEQVSPNPPAPTAWETKHGYTRVEVPDTLGRVRRDHKITHDKGVALTKVDSVNAVQPTVDPREARIAGLSEKIKNDTDTPDEFREYIKLRDNL